MSKKKSGASKARYDKKYPPELKADVVKRVVAGEWRPTEAARRVGSSEKAIRLWLGAAGFDPKKLPKGRPRRAHLERSGPTASLDNGHARPAPLAVASDSIEDLVKALTAHQEAIKTIKAKLRDKLE